MLAKKTPPEYGESLGPMMVACTKKEYCEFQVGYTSAMT